MSVRFCSPFSVSWSVSPSPFEAQRRMKDTLMDEKLGLRFLYRREIWRGISGCISMSGRENWGRRICSRSCMSTSPQITRNLQKDLHNTKQHGNEPSPSLRCLPKTQTPIRALRPLPRYRIPNLPPRHLRQRRLCARTLTIYQKTLVQTGRRISRLIICDLQPTERTKTCRETARQSPSRDSNLCILLR